MGKKGNQNLNNYLKNHPEYALGNFGVGYVYDGKEKVFWNGRAYFVQYGFLVVGTMLHNTRPQERETILAAIGENKFIPVNKLPPFQSGEFPHKLTQSINEYLSSHPEYAIGNNGVLYEFNGNEMVFLKGRSYTIKNGWRSFWKNILEMDDSERACILGAIKEKRFIPKEQVPPCFTQNDEHKAYYTYIERSPLTKQVVQRFIKKIHMELFSPGSPLEVAMDKWAISALLNSEKYTVRYEDTGYDVSCYPKETGQMHRIEDYKTVGNFLEEPTGETVATYIPGQGIDVERYHEEFARILYNYLHQWCVEQVADIEQSPEFVQQYFKNVPADYHDIFFGDFVFEELENSDFAPYEWIEEYSKKSLASSLLPDKLLPFIPKDKK